METAADSKDAQGNPENKNDIDKPKEEPEM